MFLDQLRHSPPIRITAVYLLASSAWVLLSDIALSYLGMGDAAIAAMSTFKGIVFVFLTGILLYLHVRREFALRYQVEAALRESELRFHQLVQEAPAGIFVQTEGRFAYVNPTATHLFGVESEVALLGKPVLEMFHPQGHALIQERIHQLNVKRLPVPRIVEMFLKSDGTPFEVEVSAVPVMFNNKMGALVFFQDITERRQMEKALRESELRFRQLAENIKEVFYLNDAEKRQTLYISPTYEQVWGRTCESLYRNPRSFVDAIHPVDRQKVIASFTAQQEGKAIEVMYRIRRPDGTVRWIRSRAFPIMDAQGAFTRIAGIAEDVTELVKSQNKLKRLSRRLMHVLDEERARIARELHDQVGQELTGLGINLQIMTVHCGQVPAAQTVLDDSKALVSTIMERIRIIIADLRPLVLDDMGLAVGLRWYCEKFTRRSGIAVKMDVMADTTHLNASVSNTLYQVVQEALINVMKHAQATTVWVSLRADDQLVSLTVRDDGIGFDASSVMADNYNIHWGLRIMQERVQGVVGARLHIQSARGQGTSITVEVQL